jgi:uridine kinase
MARRVSQSAAIEEIDRIAAVRRNRTLFVGVDGHGGAGKSTFAAAVAAAVPRTTVVHVDDFASPAVPEWDWDRFRAQVLLPLLDGRPAHYQRWDWARDEGAEWHNVPAGRLVLIEGVSSTRHEVAAPWTLTVWVDAPREVRVQRAVERDGPELLDRWLSDWMPSEDAYVARENPLARMDLIVSGVENREERQTG